MNLRNGKVKDIIDLDDYVSPVKRSPYNTRYQLERIKTEPNIFYESEAGLSTTPMFNKSNRLSDGSKWLPEFGSTSDTKPKIETTAIESSSVDMVAIQHQMKEIKTEMIEEEFMEYYREQLPSGSQTPQTKPVNNRRVNPVRLNPAEKPSYECHLCGKSFRHLCRLRTHMPTHTGRKSFFCKFCPKKYTSASSLNAHTRGHFGEAPRRRPSRQPKGARAHQHVDKSKIGSSEPKAVPQPPDQLTGSASADVEKGFNKFLEFKAEPCNIEQTMTSIDLEAPTIEFIPFVWDDTDLEPKIPSTTILKQKFSNQSLNNILKPSNKENKAKFVPPKFPPPKKIPKFNLWQKESADLFACYVDVLQQPKSKRSLFTQSSRNQQNSSLFNQCLPTKARHSAVMGNVEIPQSPNINSSSTELNGKNNQSAIEYREIGDIEFILKQWQDAREWYNRSICHAKNGTIHIPIGYAKRAQCFFNLGMYKKCWIDLMLAEKTGLPTELQAQLTRHKQTCRMTIMQSEPTVDIEPMLNFPADPMFPEMANVLQINYNEMYGRHITAKQAIDVGQIVLIEKAFVSMTTEYYEKCCICLTGDTNLVPCPKCTKALLCRRCVGRKFHKIECELQSLNELHGNIWLPKVVRSILSAIAIFSNVDELMNFVEAAISIDYQTIPDAIPDLKSKYRAFLQLVHKPKIKTELISTATVLQTAFLKHEITGRFFETMKHRRFLAHLILHHIEVISKFGTKTNDNGESGCVETTAPIASYLNHSCAPNAAKFLLGNSVIVVTMRPIKKGQQLFVSYCDVRKTDKERQNILLSKHGFYCMCERCSHSSMPPEIQSIPYSDRIRSEMIECFVKQNFTHLASNNQEIRKQLTEHILNVLNTFGRMPWNHTVSWAYVVYSILLSHRFQKKLRY